MKTRLNKTGNTQGELILINKTIDWEGNKVEEEGIYDSIEGEYINYLTFRGDHRNAHYKDCYRITEEIF